MPNIELLPVTEWIAPIDNSTEVRLVEPDGSSYDPNGIPSWLGCAGLDYLIENPGNVRLTLLYNMQRTAADLGDPEELEKIAQTATSLGDVLSVGGPGPSYVKLRNDTFLSRNMPLFNTAASRDPRNNAIAYAISDAFTDRHDSTGLLQRAFNLLHNDTARRERTIQTAAGALSMNAADWLALDNAGATAAMCDSDEPQHVVMSLHPSRLDLARKAREILGLQVVDERHIGEDAWPAQETLEAFVLQSIMATGKFDTALV